LWKRLAAAEATRVWIPWLTGVHSHLPILSRLFDKMAACLLYWCRVQMLAHISINLLTGSQSVSFFKTVKNCKNVYLQQDAYNFFSASKNEHALVYQADS
jgi:hypothetical protein